MIIWITYGVATFMTILICVRFATVIAGDNVPTLYPLYSQPFNMTTENWLMKYWNCTASIPESEHPRYDTTGENCNVGQQGPVWFLDAPVGEGSITRAVTCTIPSDEAIFIPLLTGECDNSEVGTQEEVTKCSKEGNNGGNIKLFVDGKPLLMIKGTSENDYSNNRVLTEFFNIQYNPANVWGLPAGIFQGRADGYFAILKPLYPGKHLVQFDTSVVSPISSEYNYHTDMTYNLMITNSSSK